jgi:hypothetical protein
MKPFAKYLAESERTYDYRIKILGRANDDLVRQLKQKLDQFDPVSLGDVRSTPIQKVPTDFPNNQNEAVSMFDVKFKYPAIDAQIKQLWQLLGQNPNHIVMGTTAHAEGLAQRRAARGRRRHRRGDGLARRRAGRGRRRRRNRSGPTP